jgi:NAD(P)-dependent dehydrogenase (short-subunit alcohol dehydrogenase family)
MSKVVVITGASSGIGYYTAKIFAQNGFKVYGLCRTKGDLENVTYISADLTSNESVDAAFRKIREENRSIDILINNAGVGISGAVEFSDMKDVDWQFNVNVFGAMRCIRYAVPLMRQNGGKIINISSVAAVFPLPFQGVYSMTKSALNSLTLVLRNELRDFSIGVCSVMPGDAKTGFTDARRQNSEGDDIYRGIISNSVNKMIGDELKGRHPSKYARRIYEIAMKRSLKPFYATDPEYSIAIVAERFLPRRFVFYVISKMYIRRPKGRASPPGCTGKSA